MEAEWSKSGRPYRKSLERREEIVSRAMELFAEQGVGASLRSIGDAIGVSHAALRYYFPTRDDLLVAVYRAHEQAVADLPENSPQPNESAVETMERSAILNRTIPGLVELYATLTTDALQAERHPTTRAFVQRRFRQVRADLTERVRQGQRAGTVAEDIAPEDAASLVAAASDGLQIQWLLDPDGVDVHRSLRLLERLFPGRGRAD